jgi:hypothetical protein
VKHCQNRFIPAFIIIELLVILRFFCDVMECSAQGTLTKITFDGLPVFLGGIRVDQYEEAGMSFIATTNTQAYGGFSRFHSSSSSDFPYNGTAFIQCSVLSPVQVTSTNGTLFGLLSVDLAEQGQVIPDAVTVLFTGYHADGSTVTASFRTDGIIGTFGIPDFQTFYFGPEFRSGLTRVVISPSYPTLWSLDNLVVSIPEPGAGLLLILGATLLGARRFTGKGSSE